MICQPDSTDEQYQSRRPPFSLHRDRKDKIHFIDYLHLHMSTLHLMSYPTVDLKQYNKNARPNKGIFLDLKIQSKQDIISPKYSKMLISNVPSCLF